MGYHIPDSPRGERDPPRERVSCTTSTSTGTSTDAIADASVSPPAPRRLLRRRNAMASILTVDVAGSPRMPPIGMTTDHRAALLQFQEQLRSSDTHGRSTQTKTNSSLGASRRSMAGQSARKGRDRIGLDWIEEGLRHLLGPSHGRDAAAHRPMNGSMGAAELTPAERLAALMTRHALPTERVAAQLGWTDEQLTTYLAPENRSQVQRWRTASPEMENGVEKLLMRHTLSQATAAVQRSGKTLLVPSDVRMRQTRACAQMGRVRMDRRGVLQPAGANNTKSVKSDDTSASYDTASPLPASNHRKRKRKPFVKPLTEFESTALTRVRPTPSSDALCPIRIDVDVDGVRYQDTLLINSTTSSISPEALAAWIAADERLNSRIQTAIAEQIRRQLIDFASFVNIGEESLHPIYLDIVVDGIALRDQFEWDIHSDLNSADAFAATLCSDLNLSSPFEPAIAFAIREQVYAYRRVLYNKRWIGSDPVAPKTGAKQEPMGIATLDAIEDTILRESSEMALWQPVVSELGSDESQYLTSRVATQRRPTTTKKPNLVSHTNGRISKRPVKLTPKEHKMPRPINPFILYCQLQKDIFVKYKQRRSASETRKILGDMWRKMADDEKEYYAQLTEVENGKRRRDHILELRDRAIVEWEEDEARRLGLLGSSVLDVSTDHLRGLLLANYMNDRHDVDARRAPLSDEGNDEDEIGDDFDE